MDDFRIEGLDGVLERMRTLGPKLQRKGLAAAVRKGAAIVRKSAVAGAKAHDDPSTPNAIWRNISVKLNAKESRKVGGIVMNVGVRGGARQYADTKHNVRKRRVGKTYKTLGSKGNRGGDTWYWRFLEFGTSHQRAQPFLRPALANNTESATNAIVAELKKQLDKLGAI